MTLTGVGNNGVLGGIYVGPYIASIDGVTTEVICDDFVDETTLGESWLARVTTLSDLTGTKWGGGATAAQQYQEAAWLTLQLLNPPPSCNGGNCAGDIQYAIWEVFDHPAAPALDPFAYLPKGSVDLGNAKSWLSLAEQNYNTGVDYSNILIYTPVSGGPPQEFLAVKTPEPPLLGLLIVDLSAIAAALLLLRRRLAWFKGLS